MNHCGRPECECRKRCCDKCGYVDEDMQVGEAPYCVNPDCPCHTEKPVQRKNPLADIREKIDAINSGPEKPVQEKMRCCKIDPEMEAHSHPFIRNAFIKIPTVPVEKGSAVVCPHGILIHPELPCKICSPASESWEERFDKEFYYHGDYIEEPREKLKAFITSLLAVERGRGHTWYTEQEAYIEGFNSGKKIGEKSGAKQERARIEAAIEEIRATPTKNASSLGITRTNYYNAALDAVLKVVRLEGN